MKLKIAMVLVALSLVTFVGIMAYDVSRMDTETIILCASNEGGILIPGDVCKYYLYNYRDMKTDVEELSGGAGLAFILNGNNDTKYEIAEHFIANGLDVNGINHYGEYNLTPIYGAILLNDVNMANFLLGHGANPGLKPPSINMSVQEFCQSLQKRDPSVDRSEMLSILANR